MFKKIILAVTLTLTLAGAGFAADKVTAEQHLIGGTFKNLARAYVATANIEELKTRNVKRIESMRPDWFRQQYAEVYELAKGLPPKIRTKYGLNEGISQDEAVRIVKSLNKPKLYEIIDNLPDPVIANRFFAEMQDGEAGGKGGNLMDRIGRVWNKIVASVNKSPSKKAAQP